MVVRIRKRATTTNGDEARVSFFREDQRLHPSCVMGIIWWLLCFNPLQDGAVDATSARGRDYTLTSTGFNPLKGGVVVATTKGE